MWFVFGLLKSIMTEVLLQTISFTKWKGPCMPAYKVQLNDVNIRQASISLLELYGLYTYLGIAK